MNTSFFSVLAEPNRLNIVEILSNQPQSVNQIVMKLHIRQPQVSKHLKILADAGVVDVNPIANKRIYALKPQAFKELDLWLKKYRVLWEDRFNALDKVLEKEKQKLKEERR
ncbi:MAG TPA: metalloregulator ArsR/SmtB family transcription factor [Patescibacteria group bacterium]